MNEETVIPEVVDAVEVQPQETALAVPDEMPKTLPIIVHGKVVNAEPSYALKYQFNRCNRAMRSATMEMCRFGAMLEAVDDSLLKNRFNNKNNPNGQGLSLKVWLEQNCPEINYATAKSYQYAAKGVRNLIQLAQDRPLLPLMGVQELADDDGEEYRQKIIETVANSSLNILRRAAMPQLPGNALKGTHGVADGRRALTAEEKAAEAEKMMRELIGSVGAYLRGNWFEMLTEQSQDDFVNQLKHYVEVMVEKQVEC